MRDAGFFVTFEGGEGAGKTTLIKSLHDYLVSKGKDVMQTFEPGATDFGKGIRAVLLDDLKSDIPAESELFLYLADRAYHVKHKIFPALAAGKVVLCDRFTDSTVAYQGAGRGVMSMERIESISLIATKGLTPDLTFFLDIDPASSLQRLQRVKDRLESEDISFHEKVRKGYLLLAKENPHRMIVIDARMSKEEVFEHAKKHLDIFMKKANLSLGPLRN